MRRMPPMCRENLSEQRKARLSAGSYMSSPRRRPAPSLRAAAQLGRRSWRALLTGGASATVGGILARFIDVSHANYIDRQLDRGGLLLWVRTTDEEDERRAIEILKRHAGDDVHIHGMPYGYGQKFPIKIKLLKNIQEASVLYAAACLNRSQMRRLLLMSGKANSLAFRIYCAFHERKFAAWRSTFS